MLEKQIEAKVVKWARANGFLALKLNGLGQRSWPDRMFISMSGAVVFIEFKTLIGRLSDGQHETITQLERCNQNVRVMRDPVEAIEYLKGFM